MAIRKQLGMEDSCGNPGKDWEFRKQVEIHEGACGNSGNMWESRKLVIIQGTGGKPGNRCKGIQGTGENPGIKWVVRTFSNIIIDRNFEIF